MFEITPLNATQYCIYLVKTAVNVYDDKIKQFMD